ncbi:PTS transporter subunit EIIC [Lactobacillus rodentium]|uniref:Cellobiose-specific PTS system IIC component n=1 Tax=Lactobacillus rodentium TaxID=947835 RepID=A0A2Z6TQ03_9LACO|nr:PTS transporter subunit EIIC [Lactobacillus rodentium]MCR1894666.1 PTS transporter subunit EIIC [Lactobacillus rodentium]GBG04857.1 cellobiose-specific PTS system IIC component [Lactobacillus rodentium]
MENIVLRATLWFRKKIFFRITDQTLKMVMPLAIIGSFFQFLWRSVFSDDSLISNICYFDNWMPDSVYNAAWYACQGLSNVIFNTMGLFVVYFAAHFTAKTYHKDAQMAGLTGMLSLLLCTYRFKQPDSSNLQMNFNWRSLGVQSLIFALVVGYIVGLIFRFLGADFRHVSHEDSKRIEKRAFAAFKPLVLSLTLGLIVGALATIVQFEVVASNIYQFFQNEGQNNLNIWEYVPLLILALVLNWMGMTQPILQLTSNSSSATTVANLNYALRHGSSWNVPNKFLGNSIYQSYGRFGGSGLTLALLIAILLIYKYQNTVRVARWSFIPTLFSSNQGALVGIPIILNPLYLVPYVFLPVLNILIAASAIALGWVPTSAYPILTGTPGPLVAFIGTNGNWNALILSLLLFVMDILLYLPVVKIAAKVEDEITRINEREGREVAFE